MKKLFIKLLAYFKKEPMKYKTSLEWRYLDNNRTKMLVPMVDFMKSLEKVMAYQYEQWLDSDEHYDPKLLFTVSKLKFNTKMQATVIEFTEKRKY